MAHNVLYIEILYIVAQYIVGLYNDSMTNPTITLQGLPKACNEALILSALLGKPKHGYQIVLDIEAKSNGAFALKHGTLYPILHRLEKDGLIEGTWSNDGPKAKRKSYQLTQRGRAYGLEQKSAITGLVHDLFSAIDEKNTPPTANDRNERGKKS